MVKRVSRATGTGLAFLFIPELTHPRSSWVESEDYDKLGKGPQLIQKRKAWKPE